jgi:hypothetical protein
MATLTEEVLKFQQVGRELENRILHFRFESLDELNEKLESEFGITAEETENSKEDAKDGIDFCLCAGVNKYWGYVDIHYLLDNDNRLLITKVTVSEE